MLNRHRRPSEREHKRDEDDRLKRLMWITEMERKRRQDVPVPEVMIVVDLSVAMKRDRLQKLPLYREGIRPTQIGMLYFARRTSSNRLTLMGYRYTFVGRCCDTILPGGNPAIF
jgi:hypothetical protein